MPRASVRRWRYPVESRWPCPISFECSRLFWRRSREGENGTFAPAPGTSSCRVWHLAAPQPRTKLTGPSFCSCSQRTINRLVGPTPLAEFAVHPVVMAFELTVTRARVTTPRQGRPADKLAHKQPWQPHRDAWKSADQNDGQDHDRDERQRPPDEFGVGNIRGDILDDEKIEPDRRGEQPPLPYHRS